MIQREHRRTPRVGLALGERRAARDELVGERLRGVLGLPFFDERLQAGECPTSVTAPNAKNTLIARIRVLISSPFDIRDERGAWKST